MTIKEICWLAGLLEGEGSFFLKTTHTKKDGTKYATYPLVQVHMKDRDIVQRAFRLLGGGNRIYRIAPRHKHCGMFYTAVGGDRAAAWMMTLYPLMGERRQKKIRDVLSVWKSPYRIRKRSLSDPCVHGHVGDLVVDGRGLMYCRTCKAKQRSESKQRRRRDAKQRRTAEPLLDVSVAMERALAAMVTS